ncbi:MAG: ATP-binding protein, partial [Anaerolineae bacterium]|nr:ATP-binding protein [Anaerolineae bacterium]
AAVNDVKMAFLPPMSGLVALEDKLERGSIFRRIGEGTTANVLRNLCYQLWEHEQAGQSAYWTELTQQLQQMFGVVLLPPQYHRSSGIITMLYKDQSGVELDLSAAGRGMLQILLLLSYLYNHPGAVLLLDEPDAHLEILRQGEIYRRLTGIMRQMNAQVIMATHSEELMNEAAGQEDTLIAFVGRPHRINDHSSRAQVAKALRDIPYHDYYKALQTGWILYLEGRSDLIILQKLARTLHHPGADYLERVFVYEVKNQPAKARDHFYALREAKSDLQGLALFDRLKLNPTEEPLRLLTWRKREIEIYLCQYTTLLAYATAEADPDRQARQQAAMEKAVQDVSSALEILGKPSPWSADIKASDEVLIPIFKKYFASLGQPNMMQHKADFALLIPFITPDSLDPEVVEKLNAILDVAQQARPGESHHP